MIWANWRARLRRNMQWHRWFAWRPVELGDYGYPEGLTAWLETIERKLEAWGDGEGPNCWSYRRKTDQPPPEG